jgi:hypothetical protein
MQLLGKSVKQKGPEQIASPRSFQSVATDGLEQMSIQSGKAPIRSINLNIGRNSNPVKGSEKVSVFRAGPVELKNSCLSCSGSPSHVVEMLKLACVSYKPSQVHYRNKVLNRPKLLAMRKMLIDKCEDVINSVVLPHGELNLRAGKIFNDMVQMQNE